MKGRITWVFLGLVVLVLAFATSSALLYRLLFGILAVPLIGYAGSWLAVRGLNGEVRLLTPFLQVGGTLDEEAVIRSRHWWPKLLLEVEHETRPFGKGGRVTTLWPYRSASWAMSKHCERRGTYAYGVLVVTSRDPLGLFSRSVRVGHSKTALVYPATVDIPGFFVPSGRGWTEGVVKGTTFAPSSVASGIREYVPGDTMGRIHWPATARAGKLMVKEFEHEPSGPADAVWVMLDLDASVQAGEGTESTVEYGVTVAASIAKRFLDNGMTVGMVIGGPPPMVIKPGAGLAQLGHVLQTLAVVEADSASSVADIAAATSAELTTGACVVLVSPASTDAISSAATLLETHGGTVIPVLLDAGSFAGKPPAPGGQYRLPGTALNAYVIHRGDKIERQLDHRIHGTASPQPVPAPVRS